MVAGSRSWATILLVSSADMLLQVVGAVDLCAAPRLTHALCSSPLAASE